MAEVTPFRSLVDAISFRRQCDPQGQACVFLSGDGDARAVSNEQFYHDMQHYALGLTAKGVRQGDIVLLALGHDYELLACFWGAICCGAIPSVMTYWNPGADMDVYARKIKRLAKAVGARIVITLPDLYSSITAALAKMGCLVFTAQEIATALPERVLTLPELEAEQIALLQFTSGTTSQPKAIQFSHRAILDHIAVTAQAYQVTLGEVNVSWLPFYHDMGLIGHIRSLIHGALLVSMAPQDWLRHPEMFLKAIHQYRGTISWMPNFGFNYCAQHIRENDLAGIDLSSLRVLCNGSEPVSLSSMQRFSERFAPYGFLARALTVAYGMAENVVGISVTTLGQPLQVDWVSVDAIQVNNFAMPVEKDSAGARAIVSCGYPYRGIDLAIVDDQWAQLAEREVGEITIRSNTLFNGYYLAPEETEGSFRDGWFRTGDLGYFAAGQLYVCDRKKDLIIVGGRNVHPQAIEDIAASVFGQSAGRCAAFGLTDPHLGTEMPVLVIELRKQLDDPQVQKLLRRVRQQVADELDIALADLRLVPKRWVVKTTSGKVARAASRKKYLDEGYNHQHEETRLSTDDLTVARLQLIMTNLFEMVLGVKGVGLDDDFVILGGDSLSAMRLFLEIEQRFGQGVKVAEFFSQPTVAQMTAILSRQIYGETTVEKQTPPALVGAEQQLFPRKNPPTLILWHKSLKDIKRLVRQKVVDLTYKVNGGFVIWLYGQKWAQRVFARGRTRLMKQFYLLLENPLQSETEAIQCSLIFEASTAIKQSLLNQVFSHRPGYWSLQVDIAPLERAYKKGEGVIMVGRHFDFNPPVTELALGYLKPDNFSMVVSADQFLPRATELKETLSSRNLNRLKLPIFVDQLLKSKNVLARGGIVLILPDVQDGLSRSVFLPFHGRMRDFKTGFAELAIETGATVIPISVAVDVRKRQVRILFLEPLDNGQVDMDREVRVERLIRQYATFLKEEWACCPGIVPSSFIGGHLDSAPFDGSGYRTKGA